MRTWLLLPLLLCACGKESTNKPGQVASCNMPKAKNCREYRAENLAAGSDSLGKLCGVATEGTFAGVACPTADVVGRCVQAEHTDVFYTGYPIPAEDMEKSCVSMGGTFRKP